jgi:hypothetical protein
MSLFDVSDRARQYQTDLLEFMDSHVYPAEAVYDEQMRAAGDPHFHPPVLSATNRPARNNFVAQSWAQRHIPCLGCRCVGSRSDRACTVRTAGRCSRCRWPCRGRSRRW